MHKYKSSAKTVLGKEQLGIRQKCLKIRFNMTGLRYIRSMSSYNSKIDGNLIDNLVAKDKTFSICISIKAARKRC